MPAVIDTGGPRVLHCVERADCPIRKPQSILTISRSSNRSYSVRKQQPRFPINGVHRCTENDDSLLLQRSSIDETGKIPGNDERDGFFNDERSPPPRASATSSNDLGYLAARKERRRSFGDRKHYDANQRRCINRRKRIRNEIQRPGGIADSSEYGQDIPVSNDILLRNETPCQDPRVLETLRQRTPTNFLAKEPHGSSGTTAGALTRPLPYNDSEPIERSSDIVMRLFGGCNLEEERETMYRRVVQTSAAISSQRVLNCAEYEWECNRECLSTISNDFVPMKTKTERATSERRKYQRPSRDQNKKRSYVQMALLMFLVAFGHGSLSKSNFGAFGFRAAGSSAGLGVLTIGTIVGSVSSVPVDLDAGIRAERSANLSHITGASRKIQMYVKNRHLQILRDGTVNGSNDDTSEYTIFQRTSVSRGQLRIQGVATCLYLCMDSCGLLYGSREYTEECVFNETLEQHNYNTYSSVRWSTPKKSLYLGLNRRGQPRRVQAKGHNLGRLSAYARVLTQVAPPERVEALQARMLGAQHNLRHHHNSHHHRNMQNRHQQQQQQQQHQQQQGQQQSLCPTLPPQEKDGRDKFRCRKRKKRKKWKRRCNDGEKPGPHCGIVENHGRASNASVVKSQSAGESGPPQSKRSCEGEASEELCRKQALDAPAKKRKSRIEGAKTGGGTNKQQQKRKKEARVKEPDDTSNSDGRVNDKAEDVDSGKRKISGANGNGKKKAGSSQRQKTPSPDTRTKKMTGRPTRTTITASKILDVTLPSSWYPSLVSPTPSTEVLSWDRRTKSTSSSARNSVTSSTSKEEWAVGEQKNFRMGKSPVDAESLVSGEITRHEASTERTNEERSGASSLPNDWSMETSEEVKSEELSMQQDDETTLSFGEYSTLMTTMDTTPPARTEDYTRATTQSIINSAEILAPDFSEDIDDSGGPEMPKNLSDDTIPLYERLAM